MKPDRDPKADGHRLQRWVDSLPEAVATIEAGIGRSVDYCSESLLTVWEWALRHCRAADIDPTVPTEHLPPMPEWTALPAHRQAWMVYSVPTLWVLDAVARYHAECLLRRIPAFRWVVFDDPTMVTPEDGELALVLGEQTRRGLYPMNVFPVRDLTVLATRAVNYGNRSPAALLDLHKLRFEEAKGVLREIGT